MSYGGGDIDMIYFSFKSVGISQNNTQNLLCLYEECCARKGLPSVQISPGQVRFWDTCPASSYPFLLDDKCPGLVRIKSLVPQQLPLQQLC